MPSARALDAIARGERFAMDGAVRKRNDVVAHDQLGDRSEGRALLHELVVVAPVLREVDGVERLLVGRQQLLAALGVDQHGVAVLLLRQHTELDRVADGLELVLQALLLVLVGPGRRVQDAAGHDGAHDAGERRRNADALVHSERSPNTNKKSP